MLQNSDELILSDIQAEHEEYRRVTFVLMLKKAFTDTGLTQAQAQVLGIEQGAFWRATQEQREKYQNPQRSTLLRWCNILYKAGRRKEDRQRYIDIIELAGYAPPHQVNEALKRTTTATLPIVQQAPTTETLGKLAPMSYAPSPSPSPEKPKKTKRQFAPRPDKL